MIATPMNMIAAACLGLSLVTTAMAADTKMTKKDHITMRQGKMVVYKDGQDTVLEGDMTLGNGTTVMKDGTVVKKDGKKMMLKDGEAIDMAGKRLEAFKKDSGKDPLQQKP